MEQFIILILIFYLFRISYIDYKTKKITNKSLIPILIMSIVYIAIHKSFISSIIGALIGGIILLIIAIISNGGIGGGDIKLMAALGLFLGTFPTILAIILTFTFPTIIIYPYALISKIDLKNLKVPMAPFITLSFIVAYLIGYKLINWYISLF